MLRAAILAIPAMAGAVWGLSRMESDAIQASAPAAVVFERLSAMQVPPDLYRGARVVTERAWPEVRWRVLYGDDEVVRTVATVSADGSTASVVRTGFTLADPPSADDDGAEKGYKLIYEPAMREHIAAAAQGRAYDPDRVADRSLGQMVVMGEASFEDPLVTAANRQSSERRRKEDAAERWNNSGMFEPGRPMVDPNAPPLWDMANDTTSLP